jgi:acetone monooxygenase
MINNKKETAGTGHNTSVSNTVDVVVIGAGFAGLYAHYKIREMGLSIQGFEAGPDVGGT